MCELLGLCFQSPVGANVTMNQFAMRDAENGDGWGLAWYRGRSLAMAKEPLTWRDSKYADFLTSYPHLLSDIYIAHVRNRTVGGEPVRADTHPFSRELFGRDFCFTHNGTVREAMNELPLDRFQPVGGTDSEYVFCWLLDRLAAEMNQLDADSDWRWLYEQLDRINRFGKFNCMLSDGRRLFCYHDLNGFKGLCRYILPALDPQESLADETMHVEIDARHNCPGVVVATKPLNDDAWVCMEPGELLVVEAGEIATIIGQPRKTSAHEATLIRR